MSEKFISFLVTLTLKTVLAAKVLLRIASVKLFFLPNLLVMQDRALGVSAFYEGFC